MTKLMQWLSIISVFLSIYFTIVTRQIKCDCLEKWMFEIQVLPFILVILFGVYAATTVLYRTLTFNDCEEAAVELTKQIKEARADLKSKGLKFSN